MAMKRRWKVQKDYLLFIIFFYFFILRDWLEHNILLSSYGDELFALLAIPFFVSELKRNRYRLKIKQSAWGYGRCVTVFWLTGLFASAVYMYQNFIPTALVDAFLCLKFWLAIYVGKRLFAKMKFERYGRKIYAHVKLVTLVYILLFTANLVWNIFPTEIRYGMRSTRLMYSHPTVFAGCCVFLVMVLLSVRNYAPDYNKWLSILLLLMCTTLRSKAFGTALAIVMICYFVFYRKKPFRLRTLIIFIPLAIILGWEQIEFYFFISTRSDSARYQLLVKSLEIAKDYFPIGTGFGTFASYYSGVNYSPVYRMYGLTNVHGLRQGAASFMSDSFWPMILGQTGCIGMIAYILAIVMLFREIQNIRKVSLSYYAAALCGMCYLLVSSIAEAALVHPLALPIGTMIGFLSNQATYSNETDDGKMTGTIR